MTLALALAFGLGLVAVLLGGFIAFVHIVRNGLPNGWHWGHVGLVTILVGVFILLIAYNNYDIQRDAPWNDRAALTGYGICPASS